MQQRLSAQDSEKIRGFTGHTNPELTSSSAHFKPGPGDSVLPSIEDLCSTLDYTEVSVIALFAMFFAILLIASTAFYTTKIINSDPKYISKISSLSVNVIKIILFSIFVWAPGVFAWCVL